MVDWSGGGSGERPRPATGPRIGQPNSCASKLLARWVSLADKIRYIIRRKSPRATDSQKIMRVFRVTWTGAEGCCRRSLPEGADSGGGGYSLLTEKATRNRGLWNDCAPSYERDEKLARADEDYFFSPPTPNSAAIFYGAADSGLGFGPAISLD